MITPKFEHELLDVSIEMLASLKKLIGKKDKLEKLIKSNIKEHDLVEAEVASLFKTNESLKAVDSEFHEIFEKHFN